MRCLPVAQNRVGGWNAAGRLLAGSRLPTAPGGRAQQPRAPAGVQCSGRRGPAVQPAGKRSEALCRRLAAASRRPSPPHCGPAVCRGRSQERSAVSSLAHRLGAVDGEALLHSLGLETQRRTSAPWQHRQLCRRACGGRPHLRRRLLLKEHRHCARAEGTAGHRVSSSAAEGRAGHTHQRTAARVSEAASDDFITYDDLHVTTHEVTRCGAPRGGPQRKAFSDTALYAHTTAAFTR